MVACCEPANLNYMCKGLFKQFIKGNASHRIPKIMTLAVTSCVLVTMITIDASASGNPHSIDSQLRAHENSTLTSDLVNAWLTDLANRWDPAAPTVAAAAPSSGSGGASGGSGGAPSGRGGHRRRQRPPHRRRPPPRHRRRPPRRRRRRVPPRPPRSVFTRATTTKPE